MVQASGLDKDTPHAAVPAGDGAGEWIDALNREGGQLDKANAEKRGIVGIGKTCDSWAQQAKQRVEKKTFLQRIFG